MPDILMIHTSLETRFIFEEKVSIALFEINSWKSAILFCEKNINFLKCKLNYFERLTSIQVLYLKFQETFQVGFGTVNRIFGYAV